MKLYRTGGDIWTELLCQKRHISGGDRRDAYRGDDEEVEGSRPNNRARPQSTAVETTHGNLVDFFSVFNSVDQNMVQISEMVRRKNMLSSKKNWKMRLSLQKAALIQPFTSLGKSLKFWKPGEKDQFTVNLTVDKIPSTLPALHGVHRPVRFFLHLPLTH